MDEIRELNEAEKKAFSLRIYSDRLAALTRKCPDDGALAHATGNMYSEKGREDWVVEYLCSKEKETFLSWTPEIDNMTKVIAKEVLAKAKKTG